ncbi:unnamed protein product [Leptidea sinapis]|uniref:Uncharacterized protein n=1 Tax=Leptidea sinapis TaxID=189913 RepID=A0A5E4R2I2_9NEOP|nr:unnamed protein product [Leptidea sinapis]
MHKPPQKLPDQEAIKRYEELEAELNTFSDDCLDNSQEDLIFADYDNNIDRDIVEIVRGAKRES